VSQLERGAKQPSGPAPVLLDLIRRKGIENDLLSDDKRAGAHAP
jgi:hypothetical protein